MSDEVDPVTRPTPSPVTPSRGFDAEAGPVDRAERGVTPCCPTCGSEDIYTRLVLGQQFRYPRAGTLCDDDSDFHELSRHDQSRAPAAPKE